MDKLESLIRELAGHGVAMEDIASKFNRVMNAVEKEQEEEERKRKEGKDAVKNRIKTAGTVFSKKWHDNMNVYATRDDYDIDDVVNLATYVLANAEWSEKQLDAFRRTLKENMSAMVAICNDKTGKELISLVREIEDKAEKIWGVKDKNVKSFADKKAIDEWLRELGREMFW